MIQQFKPSGESFSAGFARGPRGGTFRRRRPDPFSVSVDGVSWVCARVMPGKEFAVSDDLQAIGYRVFAPHGVKVYPNARLQGTNSRRGVRERDYPVFGSYVFVGQGRGQWLSREVHPHIGAVLENCGSRKIPPAFIERAVCLWVDGKWDARTTASDRFKGKKVRILGGPMVDWEGVVEKLPTELRALVALKMFGAVRSVEVDTSVLEVV